MIKSVLIKIGVALLVIALVDLIYINYWVLQTTKNAVSSGADGDTRKIEDIASPSPEALASPSPKAATEKATSTPVPTPTIVQTQVQQRTVVQTAQKEIFIPIGSGATFSNSYSDLSGVQVTVDWSKYSGIESVVFEATVKVDGGNGKAYGQLVNVTDSNPLNESTISSSSGSGEFKVSGGIPLISGVKTYGVRAKTDITEFAAHIDNARIKITLK